MNLVIVHQAFRSFARNTAYAIAYPFFYIVAIILQRFFPNLRIGYICSSRLGHFVGDIDIALVKMSKTVGKIHPLCIILVTERQVCNDYALDLIRRVSLEGLRIYVKRNYFILLFSYFIEREKFSDLHLQTYGLSEHYSKCIETPSIFKPTPEERSVAISWFINQPSVNPSNPFIFLHNRDDAFLPEFGHHSYRDFSPNVFNTVIEQYGDQYNFIRGGIVAKQKLSSHLRCCIDLPFMSHSDMADILAHDFSEFFFGSDSGINCVSVMFRKPIAGICYPPTSYGFLRKANFYSLGLIPKKLINKATGLPIGLIDMYEHKWVNFWRSEEYEHAGLLVVDNSEEEVFEFFTEALTMYKNHFDKTLIYTPEQEEFWRIVTHYEPEASKRKLILDNCFIGAGFLRRNSYLIAQ